MAYLFPISILDKQVWSLCVHMLVLLLVRELLNSGVNPDLVNEDGLTALHQVHKDFQTPTSSKLLIVSDSAAYLKNTNIYLITSLSV